MLEQMRRGQRWLTVIFIGVIGGVFVFFVGLGGPLTGQGPAGNAIIQAGQIHVYPGDFYRTRAAQQERLQEQFKDSLDSDAVQTFLDSETLRRLTENAILAHAAGEMGLQVTRAEIQDYVRTIPGFRDENGRFLTEEFESYIEYNYGSQRVFMDNVRQQLLRAKLLALILRQPAVSDAEARHAAKRRLEAVRLGFVALDSEKLPPEQPLEEARVEAVLADNESQVRRLYEERADQYQRPEARKARYIVINSAADSSEEQRAAARARAEQVHQRILDGADFADVALEHSDDEASRARGGDIGYIAKGDSRPEIEKALTSLEPGGETLLVETENGFYIVRVDEIRLANVTPFEEVSLEIARELAEKNAAKERARALAQQLSEAVRQGSSLADAAGRSGVRYETSVALKRRPDGYLPGIGTSAELMGQAFALGKDNPTSDRIFTPGTKHILIEWTATEEPESATLDAAMLEEQGRLLGAKQNSLIQDWIDSYRQTLLDREELQIDTQSVITGS